MSKAEDTKKLGEVEHMRLRPDTFCGSIELTTVTRAVLNEAGVKYFAKASTGGASDSDSDADKPSTADDVDVDAIRMVREEKLQIVPGFVGMINELLVNAADARTRSDLVTRLKVDVDRRTGQIVIENNGPAIPCVKLKKYENKYNPELLFFHLRSGTNFDDKKERLTGGRNGLGAKLCAIFSRWMSIRIVDNANSIIYTQKAKIVPDPDDGDRLDIGEPSVKEFKSGKKYADSVRITLVPDYARFGLDGLDEAHERILLSRVVDLAATLGKGVNVTLNKRSVSSKLARTFKEYVQLHAPDVVASCDDCTCEPSAGPDPDDLDSGTTAEHDDDAKNSDREEESKPKKSKKKAKKAKKAKNADRGANAEPGEILMCGGNERWEFGVCLSSSGKFQQTSFVNHINTSGGGTHVAHVWSQLLGALRKHVLKRLYTKSEIKDMTKSRTQKVGELIEAQLHLFVNASIINPAFSTQSKEVLTTNAKSFGSTCDVDSKLAVKIIKKFDVLSRLNADKDKQMMKDFKKIQNKRGGVAAIKKLSDANYAGEKNRKHTSLLICEGDSAATSADVGISILGQDYWGRWSTRGKLLNVRAASVRMLLRNEEFIDFMTIMGLERNKVYTDTSSLRYDSITELVDADLDGLHIGGLIKNVIEHMWPSLFAMPGFIRQIITPIVIASKGKQVRFLYSLEEVSDWQAEVGEEESRRWHMRYLKGLGTSTSAEVRSYFQDLHRHLIPFYRRTEQCNEAIDLAFNEGRVNDRKQWLLRYADSEVEAHVPKHPDTPVSFHDFVHRELILFSWAANRRAIPSLMDGLKPSQRKVLYTMFKTKVVKDVKVAQLGAKVAELTHYAHGEASLNLTIVNLAQCYTGSGNNINLLYPSGMFGTRRENGKDSASARYIFTRLCDITSSIFRPDDFGLLKHIEEENNVIEPVEYQPIVPMVLINSTAGIGFGFSTSSPSYCPRQIIQYLKRMIELNNTPDMDVEPAMQTSETISDTREHSEIGLEHITTIPDVVGEGADKTMDVDVPRDDVSAVDPLVNDNVLEDDDQHQVHDQVASVTVTAPVSQYKRPEIVLQPFYKHFRGTITSADKQRYSIRGVANVEDGGDDDISITITEIPFTTSIEKYHSLVKNWKKDGYINDFRSLCSEYYPYFELHLNREQFTRFEQKQGKGDLFVGLQLVAQLSTSNMVFFVDGRLRLFQDVYEVIDAYYERRLQTYQQRIALLLQQMREDIKWLQNKRRFIQAVNDREIEVVKQNKVDAITRLVDMSYDAKPGSPLDGYGYLLSLSLSSLHIDAVEQIENECTEMQAKIDDLERTTAAQLWTSELGQLLLDLDHHDADEMLMRTSNSGKTSKAPGKDKVKAKHTSTKSKAAQSSGSNESKEEHYAARPAKKNTTNKTKKSAKRKAVASDSDDSDSDVAIKPAKKRTKTATRKKSSTKRSSTKKASSKRIVAAKKPATSSSSDSE